MSEDNKTHTCPACGEDASGNFCQNCGASLGGRFCNQCGTELGADAKFCSECGAGVLGGGAPGAATSAPAATGTASASPRTPAPSERRQVAAEAVGGQNLAWWIAGAAMFALIVVVGLSMVRPGPGPVPTAATPTGGAAPAGAGVAPDISQMTPIEAADRLFNRVMQSYSVGDTAAAQQFLPMAVAAYNRARPLNLDGLFHLSMLNRSAMNLEAALDNAVEILDEDPNHLLGLAAAAEASIELGETEAAEDYYRRLAEIYDEERQRPLEEYQMHAQIVDVLKDDAERFLAGR